MNNIKLSAFCLLLLLIFGQCNSPEEGKGRLLLSVDQYQEDVYASWLGQIIGNTYGLSYEFSFVDNPGPDTFPYGYGRTLELVSKYNGAFSDDDTDIEYMYLTQMEKNGIEPTYFQLAEAWKTHVKERVWCANRAALTLMHAGHYPPVTGNAKYNTQWMQIDPQLVNEIWALSAPGMIDYAVEKSAFAARITNDSFGIEPTLHYAAMYSAAFFEKDIHRLIQIGKEALPKNSRFAIVVDQVFALYHQYPDDWQQARQRVKEKYLIYGEYNKHAWPPIDAQLNGALGILALLYGEGDFQKTLDYACGLGMDADNQAATMCGLLGIVNGLNGIPKHLLFPLEDREWEKPFNDSYKMITREGLADASIQDMAKRMAVQGEKIILAHGGKIIEKDAKKFFLINEKAAFIAPFELNPIPALSLEVGEIIEYPLYTGLQAERINFQLSGNIPKGIKIQNNKLIMEPKEAGLFTFNLHASMESEEKSIDIELHVFKSNLAKSAIEIIFNKNAKDHDLTLLRDGKKDVSYYSTKSDDRRELDYYGYKWANDIEISTIIYNNGVPGEFCGWFTSFTVEFLKNGQWQPLEDISISPDINLDNNQWLKPHMLDFLIRFDPIKTDGIRIIGMPGGIEKDANNAHLGMQYYSAISELKVY